MAERDLNAALIGRARELDVLNESLFECALGSTRAVVLSGEAGIGKSRLVDEFVRGLAPEAIVARGQCVDLGRDAPPYAPVIAALRAIAARLGIERVRASVTAPGLEALAVLLPEVIDELVDVTAERGRGARLFEAVASLLEGASVDGPIVVIIEDLHWADQASIALLRFLIRVVENAQVLFVLTMRADEVTRGDSLHSWIPELERAPRVRRVELARLDEAGVRRLMASITGKPPRSSDVSDVYQRSEGVPFFVEELLCNEQSGGMGYPSTLRDLLLARYEAVSETSQRMLRLISAGGVCVDQELLERVHTGSVDELESAAREALVAGVLVIEGTSLAFRHALVRDAVHDQLLPSERVRFHAQYACALEGLGSPSVADAISRSYHWMAAHDLERAFDASLVAMQRAKNSFAYAAAARMGERAIELWENVAEPEARAGQRRVELLAATADLLRDAGESERAIDLIDDALASDQPIEPPLHASLLRRKASYLANVGRLGSIALLQEALELLDGAEPSQIRARVLGELAARLMLDARGTEAIEVAQRAFDEAETVGSRSRMSVAVNIRGTVRVYGGEVEEGLADLELAGELADDNESARLRYRLNLSDVLNQLGRWADAVRVAEEGAERARLRGLERTTGVILMSNVIAPLLALGEIERADALLDRALELDAPVGFNATLVLLKLRATLWRGDPEAADSLLRTWRSTLAHQARIDVQVRAGLAEISAEIALESGDVVGAWEALAGFDSELHSGGSLDLQLAVSAARVLGAIRAQKIQIEPVDGREFDPLEVESRVLRISEQARGSLNASGERALVAAELGGESHTGDDPELWRASVAIFAEAGGPIPSWVYAQYRLGHTLALAGDRAAARAQVEEARAQAESHQLGLISSHLDELVARAGLTGENAMAARPSGTSGDVARLTPRELQVLELVAQGLSNAQIAQRLFISRKTASVHVSNILRKAGAASRTEAVFTLADVSRARP